MSPANERGKKSVIMMCLSSIFGRCVCVWGLYTHTHTLSLSHTHIIYIYITHTHTYTYNIYIILTQTHARVRARTHIDTHIQEHACTHTHTLCHTHLSLLLKHTQPHPAHFQPRIPPFSTNSNPSIVWPRTRGCVHGRREFTLPWFRTFCFSLTTGARM